MRLFPLRRPRDHGSAALTTRTPRRGDTADVIFPLISPGIPAILKPQSAFCRYRRKAMRQINWCHHQSETKPTLMRRVSRFDLRYGV